MDEPRSLRQHWASWSWLRRFLVVGLVLTALWSVYAMWWWVTDADLKPLRAQAKALGLPTTTAELMPVASKPERQAAMRALRPLTEKIIGPHSETGRPSPEGMKAIEDFRATNLFVLRAAIDAVGPGPFRRLLNRSDEMPYPPQTPMYTLCDSLWGASNDDWTEDWPRMRMMYGWCDMPIGEDSETDSLLRAGRIALRQREHLDPAMIAVIARDLRSCAEDQRVRRHAMARINFVMMFWVAEEYIKPRSLAAIPDSLVFRLGRTAGIEQALLIHRQIEDYQDDFQLYQAERKRLDDLASRRPRDNYPDLSKRMDPGTQFLNSFRNFGIGWVILNSIKNHTQALLLAAELDHSPWPADPCDPTHGPLHRVERDGKLIGAYGIGANGVDEQGRKDDWRFPIYENFGFPRASDPLPARK